jgi:hypothetical protein
MKALIFTAVLVAFAGACKSTKPSEEECERVVTHIRQLHGNQFADVGADKNAMVRSCRANSSKEMVNCMLAATNQPDLEKCGKLESPQ